MSRIKAFENVSALINGLNQVGISKFRDWKWIDVEWGAATDYYEFGERSDIWLRDNLAMYLESGSESYVERLLLCMNQRNKGHRQDSYAFFMEMFDKVFQVLELNVPDGINVATITQDNFFFENERYTIETKIVTDPRTDYYKLTISTK